MQLSSSLWSEQSRKPSHLSLSSRQASPSEQRVPLRQNRGPRVAGGGRANSFNNLADAPRHPYAPPPQRGRRLTAVGLVGAVLAVGLAVAALPVRDADGGAVTQELTPAAAVRELLRRGDGYRGLRHGAVGGCHRNQDVSAEVQVYTTMWM